MGSRHPEQPRQGPDGPVLNAVKQWAAAAFDAAARWTVPARAAGIRTRLRRSFFLLAIAPLLFLGTVLIWQSYVVQKQQAITLQRQIAQAAADKIRDYILSLENELRLGVQTSNLLGQDRARQYHTLQHLRAYRNIFHQDVFEQLSLIDRRGREVLLVSRTAIHSGDPPVDRSSAPEFLRPSQSGASYISPVHFDSTTGEPFLTLGLPLIDVRSGNFAAALVAEVRLKDLWNLIESIDVGDAGMLYIADQKGRIIAHRDPSVVLRGTRFRVPSGAGIFRGLAGDLVFLAGDSITLDTETLRVVTERPLTEALHLTIRTLSVIAVLVIVVLTGALLLGRQVSREIVAPVESLAATADAITNGAIVQRAAVPGAGELGTLAKAFNTMTTRLAQTIDSLHDQQVFLRTVIGSLTQPFYVMDASSYRVLLANKAAYGTGDAVAEGITCFQMTHNRQTPCGGDSHPCPVALVKQTGAPVVVEHVHTDADGIERDVEVHAFPIRSADGGIGQVIEYYVDITDRKKAEEDKKKMLAQLLQMQKLEAIGTLAGGIAHDFNNILAAILGYADLARLTHPSEQKYQEIMAKIIEAGNRAKHLVQQILSFSRQREQQFLPVKVQDIAAEALRLLRASLPATIEIREDIDNACRPVLADATQVHQVIVNLCTNAFHAMREKGGTLAVTVRSVEIDSGAAAPARPLLPAGSYLMLEVSDTGQGIDPSIMKRIFDPFFTTKGPGQGTGMGLSVVDGIVRSHGGQITVYSEVGTGTTFRVYLPHMAKQPGEAGAAYIPAEGIGKADLPGGSERIMLVDDEVHLLQAEQQMLESLGYRVSPYTNGQDALMAFAAAPRSYDAIITDMTMPRMTGADLAKAALSIRRDMPIILCTGFSELISADQAAGIGIRKYLTKPVRLADLSRLLRQTLDAKA